MKYLVQVKEFSHAFTNPYSKGGLAWSPWRTVSKADDDTEAMKQVDAIADRGGLKKVRATLAGKIIYSRGD